MKQPQIIERVADALLPTKFGRFRTIAYTEIATAKEHLVLIAEPCGETPLVRLHSECLTGDVLGSQRCDCGAQLAAAQKMIGQQGGILIYLRQEGRGIGLANKIRAYALQDDGMDTLEANQHLGFGGDERDYQVAAEILHDLAIGSVQLLTNNPAKIAGLEQYGILVAKRLAVEIRPNPHNESYLRTKRDRMSHLLTNLNGTTAYRQRQV